MDLVDMAGQMCCRCPFAFICPCKDLCVKAVLLCMSAGLLWRCGHSAGFNPLLSKSTGPVWRYLQVGNGAVSRTWIGTIKWVPPCCTWSLLDCQPWLWTKNHSWHFRRHLGSLSYFRCQLVAFWQGISCKVMIGEIPDRHFHSSQT